MAKVDIPEVRIHLSRLVEAVEGGKRLGIADGLYPEMTPGAFGDLDETIAKLFCGEDDEQASSAR